MDLHGATLLEAVPAAIALLDQDGKIVFLNARWERCTANCGLSSCIVGENFLEFLEGTAHSTNAAVTAIRQLLLGVGDEFSWDWDYDFGTSIGVRWFRISVSRSSELGGGAVVMYREVTDERRQAAEGERLVLELGERVKELHALHQVADLLRSDQLEPSEILERLVGIIPGAMQFPELMAARATYGEITRSSDSIVPIAELQASFTTRDGIQGEVRVAFRETPVGGPDAIFLREERSLISSLAEMLRSYFDRRASSRTLLSENQRHERQNAALVALTGSDRWSLQDEKAALSEVTETIAATLGVERVSVWRYNADRTAIVCNDLFETSPARHSAGQELQEHAYPSYFRALRENPVIAAHDAQQDPRTSEFREGYLDALGISSMLDAPILIRGKLAGVICIENVGSCRTWTPGEQSFAVSIGHVVSLFLAQRSLAHSEARLGSLFRGSPAAISINSASDGRYIEVNDLYCELVGYSREELQGKTSLELGIWSDPARRQAIVLRLLAEGSVRDIEASITQKNGGVRDVRINLELIDLPGETAPVFIALYDDTTDRRKADEALRLSDERFTLLSKATNDAIWDLNLITGALWWNEGCEKLLGFRPDELRDLEAWSRYIHPEDSERVQRHLNDVITAGSALFSTEYRFQCATGDYAHVLDRGYIIRDAAGTPIRMIGAIVDLTQRIKTAQQIAGQAALIDQARDAILVRDLNFQVSFWNKAAERIYGWSKAEAVGRQLDELLKPDCDRLRDAEQSLRDAGEWLGELDYVTKTGSKVTVDCRWTLLRDESGQPSSYLQIETDITERKLIEQQFLRAQRMESIGTLAGGIAHDLNNVLGPILMALDLLKGTATDPVSLDLISVVEGSANRGADMVRQVLSFARGIEGQRVEVQVRHIIRDVQKIADDTFLKHVEVRSCVPLDLWTILGDPTQIHQVLLNLAVNARDAMPNGGTLTFTAENLEMDEHYAGLILDAKPGPYVEIQVEDTGTGIPREIIEKIFDPFFTTKEIGKGTGLGLSTTLAIVKSHEGFVRVSSDPGRGTKFKLFLPAQKGAASLRNVDPDADMARGTGQLILVVDDEEVVRTITSRTLSAFGYKVILAADGTEALAVYAREGEKIAAVLTDMMMPIMDGIATIQVLRKMNPRLPIIAASGLASKEQISHAANLGVKHFLPKPYTTKALLKALQAVLSE